MRDYRECAEGLIGRGHAYLSIGQSEKAAAMDLTVGLIMMPGNADAWYGWGLVDCYARRYAQALEDFKTAIRLEPRHIGAAV